MSVYLTRSPVLNKARAITANRLTVHTLNEDSPVHAAAQALSELADVWPGERTVFVGFGGMPITAEVLSWRPAANTMVEIAAAQLAEPDILDVLRFLEAAGTPLCLDGYADGLRVADAPPFHFLLTDARKPVRLKDAPGVVIACGLPDTPSFEKALAAGFAGAAGWFFLRGRPKSGKLVPAHAQIVRLLNLLRKNAEVREIESALKQDVALSFKLLRYINSAGFGLQCEIQSFRHAVTILGYDKLHKWLSLLLVTASKDPAAPAFMQTAIARGRFMEIIGRNFFDRGELDNLFITGAFSLLDVLTGTPLDVVLGEMHLPEAIQDTLLRREGVFAPFLDLALACEGSEPRALAQKSDAIGIAAHDLNRAQLQALSYADSLQFH